MAAKRGSEMKMVVTRDEWFPFYELAEHEDSSPLRAVEVSKELAMKYERVMKEFKQLQEELSQL